jgi:hypothetical protein
MTTFDDRENAFENKFAHDQEMQFKAEARRNKLMGLWVADILGKTGDDAEAYAKSVVLGRFRGSGPRGRHAQGGSAIWATGPRAEVRKKYDELLAVAKGQLMDEA